MGSDPEHPLPGDVSPCPGTQGPWGSGPAGPSDFAAAGMRCLERQRGQEGTSPGERGGSVLRPGTAPSPKGRGEPSGLLGAAGHGPAHATVWRCYVRRSGSGWCRVHTREPAKRNYPCFILPWAFLVPAVRVYKSCSRQPPLRCRGQRHRHIKGLR